MSRMTSGEREITERLRARIAEIEGLNERLQADTARVVGELTQDAACEDCMAREARVATLEGWKREAILVLDQWDRVFEAAHVHEVARLGESKSAVVLRALARIAALSTETPG